VPPALWTACAALQLSRLEAAIDVDRKPARRAAKEACQGLLKNSRASRGGFVPGYRYLGSMVWDHSTVLDEAGWTATDPTNDNIQYAVNRNGSSFYKSTNRGVSFGFLRNFGGIGGWNSPFAVAPSNPSVIYFGDTRVWKSATGGTSWVVSGTLCKGEVQGTFAQKYKNCEICDFYQMVRKEEGPGFTYSVLLLKRIKR